MRIIIEESGEIPVLYDADVIIAGGGSAGTGVALGASRNGGTLTAIEIRNFAEDAGIHGVGWFSASDFAQYLATIRDNAGYRHIAYRPFTAFENAGRLPEGIRTVIVLVMDYFVEPSDQADGYRLSNYARACWNTVTPKTKKLVAFLKEHGCKAEALDVPQRAAACRAGLGFIGRNAMFYAHGLGSYVAIESVGTNATIEDSVTGQERLVNSTCDKCSQCVAACPTAAISPNGYGIEPMRCLSMLNRHPDEPKRIMPETPKQLERWLYGCETCQNVCPLNAQVRHRHDAVITSEIKIEGMMLPNTATVAGETLQAKLDSISSPGYREYARRLLSK